MIVSIFSIRITDSNEIIDMKNFDYVIRTTNARFDQGVVWIFFFFGRKILKSGRKMFMYIRYRQDD